MAFFFMGIVPRTFIRISHSIHLEYFKWFAIYWIPVKRIYVCAAAAAAVRRILTTKILDTKRNAILQTACIIKIRSNVQ